MNRREFLRLAAAGAVGAALPKAYAAGETARLESWEVVELPQLPAKRHRLMRITANTGAVGYARACAADLKNAAAAAGDANLLDHGALWECLLAKNVPKGEIATLDIAAWDLHARMLGQPLHALLGTKRSRVLRYGDVRGQQPDFSPKNYAASVASYLKRTGLKATKLHFPGNMGTPESIGLDAIKETLRAVRDAVGPEPILAWDPYPNSAESATRSVAEAKDILKLMDELGYAWIEGPLPPTPFDEQIPKYVELMKSGATLRIQAEGPGSSIGDGTSFADMKRWAEAGAINQCSTDAYINTGLTNGLRMIEYARAHPPFAINLHWAWAPHAHLAMATEEVIMPVVEFPMGEDIPREYMSGPWLLAPDWPGIYRIE